jgi:hypothetical protein
MDTSSWIAVAAALIALVAATAAVLQTATSTRQTRLQEQLYRDQQQPYVWADFLLNPTDNFLIMLVVRNEGPTIAEDVRLVLDPPIHAKDGIITDEKDISVLSHAITSLSPGREMHWILGGHPAMTEVLGRHRVNITYRGPAGPVERSYFLDYADFLGMSVMSASTLTQVVDEIKALTKVVKDATRQRP